MVMVWKEWIQRPRQQIVQPAPYTALAKQFHVAPSLRMTVSPVSWNTSKFGFHVCIMQRSFPAHKYVKWHDFSRFWTDYKEIKKRKPRKDDPIDMGKNSFFFRTKFNKMYLNGYNSHLSIFRIGSKNVERPREVWWVCWLKHVSPCLC